jgi:hypothetical protein
MLICCEHAKTVPYQAEHVDSNMWVAHCGVHRHNSHCRFWVLIAFKDEVLGLILSAPEVSDDTAIVTGPLSAIASAALTVAGSLSVLNSFGVNLEPVRTQP